MINDYSQTNDLDYASPEEQEEYNRYLDILETIISSRVPDTLGLQEQALAAAFDVDCNPDDECLDDCGTEW